MSREEAIAYVNGTAHEFHLSSISYTLDQMAACCHAESNAAGWYTDIGTGEPLDRNVGEQLCLIHSEISEAMEGERKDLPSDKLPGFLSVEEELADALIRIFDYAGARRLRIGEALQAKIAFNQSRADHKIENRLDGGKQF